VLERADKDIFQPLPAIWFHLWREVLVINYFDNHPTGKTITRKGCVPLLRTPWPLSSLEPAVVSGVPFRLLFPLISLEPIFRAGRDRKPG